MIQTDLFWQAIMDKCSAENQLVVLGIGVCRTQTRQTVYLQMTEHVCNVDDGGASDSIDRNLALGVHFPFLVRSFYDLRLGFGQFVMAFILPHCSCLLEICRNSRTTGDALLCKTGILLQLRQNGEWTPARVRFSHFGDLFGNIRRVLTKRSFSRPTHLAGKPGPALMLIPPPPFSNSCYRPFQQSCNLRIGLTCFTLLGTRYWPDLYPIIETVMNFAAPSKRAGSDLMPNRQFF